MNRPRVALREVPYAIYAALAINVIGTLVYLVILLVGSGSSDVAGISAFRESFAWFILDNTCWLTYAVAMPLGLLELARRQVGGARTLATVGAALAFAPLLWFLVRSVLPMIVQDESVFELQEWVGVVVGMLSLASGILLTLGGRAWHCVPVAAAGLVLLHLTSGWVPVIGKTISVLLDRDPVNVTAYSFVRDLAFTAVYIFVCGALAANGRKEPEPQRAASGFALARLGLVLRVYAAIVLVMVTFAAVKTPSAATFALFAGPLVVIATMVLFVIGMLRVAAAGMPGLPQLRIAIGTLLVLWSTVINLYQLGQVYDAIRDRESFAADAIDAFAIAAPIAGVFGLGLIGAAIASFASVRSRPEIASAVSGRTMVLFVVSLIGIAMQKYAPSASLAGTMLMLLFAGLVAGIVGLVMMFGILRDGAKLVEAPELPVARVV